MDINRILKIKCSEKETLQMILSHACDMGSSKGALISVAAFDSLSDNLIAWKNSLLEAQKKIISELITVAAEMALKKDMPPTLIEDWHFPKSVSKKQAVRVVSAAWLADERCRQWAVKVRNLADELTNRKKIK